MSKGQKTLETAFYRGSTALGFSFTLPGEMWCQGL